MRVKIALLLGLLVFQAQAMDSASFRFSRSIISQDNEQQTLLAVPLDGAVYAASNPDFSDLRLVDAAGIETPFVLQKIAGQKTVISRIPSNAEKPSLQKQGEVGIVISLDLKDDAPNIDGLTVFTNQRDFEYVLQVRGSEDGQNWHALVDNALIYDYSRFMRIGNTDVVLPNNGDRHFKIEVAQAVETRSAELMELTRTLQGSAELQRTEKTDVHHQPLHIERIELWHNQTETMPYAESSFDYPLTGFNISQDAEHKTTIVDIQAQNQPLNGFKLHISTPNFSRQADVQITQKQGIETRMQSIAHATLAALHFKDINRDDTYIGFPLQRRQNYRIILYNQDNPPLDIDKITGAGPGYQMVFLSDLKQNYQLRYGADKALAPSYDTAPILTLLSKGYQSVPAALGPETTIAIEKSGFDFLQLINSTLFLGLVIGLMVMVLGWSLFKVSKKL